MSARVNFQQAKYQDVMRAMLGLSAPLEGSTLEPALLELVKIRASQLNGCGYCLDMHTKDARHAGETEQRLYLVSVWREAPIYTDREKAALAWAEAVTKLENQQVPDQVYEQARAQFSEEELVRLTLAVVAINGWNRFNCAFNTVPGGYQVGMFKRA
jgi:AhpD family alkylhydroperoxidase